MVQWSTLKDKWDSWKTKCEASTGGGESTYIVKGKWRAWPWPKAHQWLSQHMQWLESRVKEGGVPCSPALLNIAPWEGAVVVISSIADNSCCSTIDTLHMPNGLSQSLLSAAWRPMSQLFTFGGWKAERPEKEEEKLLSPWDGLERSLLIVGALIWWDKIVGIGQACSAALGFQDDPRKGKRSRKERKMTGLLDGLEL